MGLSPSAAAGALAALAWLAGCDGAAHEDGASAPSSGAPAPRERSSSSAPLDAAQRAAKGFPLQEPRSSEPGVLAATAALECMDLAAANRALLALGDGFDAQLLRARLAAAEGDAVGAVRHIEALRQEHAGQARLYATAAEIHAQAGRLRSAEEEIREGLERCGPTPELSLARGVLALARPGGARVALNHLLEAHAGDPRLPFLGAPLAQAHLLLGRQALAEESLVDAIGHARAALAAQPGEVDARLLLGDALAAAGELGEALEVYEALLAAGEPVRDTLAWTCKQAATAALLEGQRELAVARNLRARELGLAQSELGFGATLLAEESQRALAQGVEAFERGEREAAGEHFARALELDPGSLAARNHLAIVLFQRGEHAEAARYWREVLDLARSEGIELPDPVHLNLARALFLEGRTDEVRQLLERELARDPQGPWAEATRELLARLDPQSGR